MLADTITNLLVKIQEGSRGSDTEIDSFDMLTDSWGANRGVIALANRSDLFNNIILIHPTGQDDMGYDVRHFDALRQLAHHQLINLLGKVPDDRERRRLESLQQLLHTKRKASEEISESDETKPERSHDKSSFIFRRLLDKRKVQKSVARAHLYTVLGDIAEKYPDKTIIIAGDEHNDRAILPQRLLANKGKRVKFVLTNWGRHSLGYNRQAFQEVGTIFRQAEAGTLHT